MSIKGHKLKSTLYSNDQYCLIPCRSDTSNTAPLAAAADSNTIVKRYAKTHAKTKPEVDDGNLGQCLSPPTYYYVDTDQVQQYWCRPPTTVNGTVVDGEYNEGELRENNRKCT